MKILLVYPPCFLFFKNSVNKGYTTVPLGLPYLAAYLKSKGREVSVLDLNMKTYTSADNKSKKLWDEGNRNLWLVKELFDKKVLPALGGIQDKWVDNIISSGYKIVGLHISATSRRMALAIAEKIKKKDRDILVIFGGPDCYKEKAEELLENPCVDGVVIGEGEVTFSELVDSYEKTGRLASCPGALLKINGRIINGGQRGPIDDLDTLPYPDFSDLINDYRDFFGDQLWLSISWLRGCPHRCAFCYESRFWRQCRGRSPQRIIDEFIYQRNKYGIKRFHKADSTLAVSEGQLKETCGLLISRCPDVTWYSQARAEKYLTLSLLQKMHQSGCRILCYGIESGSQAVLDKMNKGLDLKTEQEVVINSSKAGINVSMTIMVGAPGERLIDFIKSICFILQNLRFVRSLGISTAGVFVMSDWYSYPEKYGIILGKEKYYLWRSRDYINNRYTRALKKYILETVYIVAKRISGKGSKQPALYSKGRAF